MRAKIFLAIISVVLVGVAAFFVMSNLRKNKPAQTKTTAITAPEVTRAAIPSGVLSNNEQNWKKAVEATKATDSDLDGLPDNEEAKLGTSPHSIDSDSDGLSDDLEVKVYHTDPLKADTDGDGVNDGLEIKHRTNPLDKKSF